MAAILDEHAGALELSDEELHAIACYQSDAVVLTYGRTGYRWHELMNASLRDIHLAGVDPRWGRRIAEQVDHLQAALAKSRLPAHVTLWRGVSRGNTIEAISTHLGAGGAVVSGEVVLEGFVSASLDRDRAERFARSPLRVMMRLDVAAGTPGLWVAGIGLPRFRAQQEVLLDDETVIEVLSVEPGDPVTMVCEVVR